jgi:hypothetical protein
MKDKGILQSRREAQTVYYRIANHNIPAKCPLLIETRRNQLTKHNQDVTNQTLAYLQTESAETEQVASE